MNAHVKPLWIEALRSGRYQQGKGQLRNNNEYCCLGVLTSIAVEHGIVDPVHAYGRRQVAIHLHPDVSAWSGVARDGFMRDDQPCLTDFNDGGHTFKQIADLIEEYL